jgi:hypothetical protein
MLRIALITTQNANAALTRLKWGQHMPQATLTQYAQHSSRNKKYQAAAKAAFLL